MIEGKEADVPAPTVPPRQGKRKGLANKKIRHTKRQIREEISRLEDSIFNRGLDTHGQEDTSSDDEVPIAEPDEAGVQVEAPNKKRVAAWQDEEDLTLTVEKVVGDARDSRHRRVSALPDSADKDSYHKMLKEQFKGVVGTPKWASLQERSDEADEAEDFATKVLRTSSKLLESSGTLSPNNLNFSRLADLSETGVVQKTLITAIEFNPTAQVAAVASRAGTVTFYQVDGEKNSVIHKTALKNFPICSAKFSADGRELLMGSEFKPSMQCFDLITNKATTIPSPTKGPEISNMEVFGVSGDGEYVAVAGRDGTVALLTSGTKELIHTVKMSGRCQALTFSSDSRKLFTYGDEGKVYVWDVRQRKCLHRFTDEGCLGGLSLALSAGDRYLACGSTSGVVNIYNGSSVIPSQDGNLSSFPQPAKAIMNLTTAVHKVVFNPTVQILALSSRSKDSALKLVHLPSMSAFSNFPNKSLDLARVEVVSFSPNSGYMAVGNNIGGARLIRLHHFSNY